MNYRRRVCVLVAAQRVRKVRTDAFCCCWMWFYHLLWVMLCIFWLFCTCGYFVKLFYTAGISSAGNMKYAEKKMILATHAFVISQLFATLPHLVLNVFGTEQIDSSLSLTVNTVNNSAAVMNSNNRIFI